MGSGRYQRVSVGFDGHERSEPAVRAALELHRALGAELRVVYVSDIRDAAPVDLDGELIELWEEEERAARAHARGRLEALLASSEAGDLRADEILELATGKPPQVLVEHAVRRAPDLLVLGPHERRGRFDFGSGTRAVMGRTSCDLWVQPGELRAIERILVATDLSEHARAALEVARELAGRFGARVDVLHGYTPPVFSHSMGVAGSVSRDLDPVIETDRERDRRAFQSALADVDWGGVSHDALWLEGPAEDLIVERGAAHDLIVLGTHGRTGLAAALLGNVAYGVLKRSEVPVLAVRMPKRRWRLGG